MFTVYFHECLHLLTEYFLIIFYEKHEIQCVHTTYDKTKSCSFNKNQTTILKPVKINLSTNQYPHLHVLFKSAFKCITHVVVFNFSFCVDIYLNSSISCVYIVYPMLTVCD